MGGGSFFPRLRGNLVERPRKVLGIEVEHCGSRRHDHPTQDIRRNHSHIATVERLCLDSRKQAIHTRGDMKAFTTLVLIS